MAELSVRELIVREIEARLKVVTRARGFNTDIGHDVHRARKAFHPEELPALALFDNSEESVRGQYGTADQVMAVQAEAHLSADGEPSQVANSLAAELVVALMGGDVTLGGLATGIDYAGFGPVYPDEGSDVVSVVVKFTVRYSTMRGDPFHIPA